MRQVDAFVAELLSNFIHTVIPADYQHLQNHKNSIYPQSTQSNSNTTSILNLPSQIQTQHLSSIYPVKFKHNIYPQSTQSNTKTAAILNPPSQIQTQYLSSIHPVKFKHSVSMCSVYFYSPQKPVFPFGFRLTEESKRVLKLTYTHTSRHTSNSTTYNATLLPSVNTLIVRGMLHDEQKLHDELKTKSCMMN